MIDLKRARAELQADMRYKPLRPTWAKLEILFGLSAAGLGNLVMFFWIGPEHGSLGSWPLGALGLALLVLGGYLTLAGQRSHLYQSLNDQTAYLLEKIHRLRNEG